MESWAFKLECTNGNVLYYDSDELETAREDKEEYGGKLTDRNGREY